MSRVSRTLVYCSLSTAATAAVILGAFEARPNFFSAAMYLSQSSACLMVLTNMFLVCTLMMGKVLQNIFFGRLRAIEVDHLYEQAWYAVTESCLAMTIFRDEFDTTFFLFFTLLLCVKIFHWLARDRIEYMEQTVQVARTFHIRMTAIMVLLFTIDCHMVAYCLGKVFAQGPNVMIMFAFEFTILASSIAAVMGKYVLNLIEARQTETWDNKSGYVFYLELVADFIKLMTYLAFFATLMTFYGLPLHILRDLYMTMRSFSTKCRNFMRFRRATQDMDERYRNASTAEIEATGDKTCIVCREEMFHASQPAVEGDPARTVFDNPKRLPCGHILHFRCLRSWLERQQTCPMCRRSVLDDPPVSPRRASDTPVQPGASANATDPPRHPPDGQHHIPQGSAPTPTVQNNGTNVRLPNVRGLNHPQLPRGFRLPPGWALLPVAEPRNPAGSTNAIHGPPAIHPSPPNVAQSDAPQHSPDRVPSRTPLPPLIPLPFGISSATLPATLPLELTVEQINDMERSTRRTVEERLRILNQIQTRVSESLLMLNRLQNVQPPAAAQANTGDITPEHEERSEQSHMVEPHSIIAEEGSSCPAEPAIATTEADGLSE